MRKLFVVALAIVSFIAACTKIETTSLGSGLIPPIDNVNTFETSLNVITNTFLANDTVRVYKGDDHVIGVITNDPLFGTTSASAFFELKPTFYKYFFPGAKDSLIVDSAVLVMSYKGVYGDSTMAQSWNVYEAGEKLKTDSAYATNSVLAQGSQLIGSANLDIRKFNDSIKDRFELASNQIRIRLSDNFARKIIKTFDTASFVNTSGAYTNDSLFRESFKGFEVRPVAGQGNALIKINLLDSNTKLALYYKYAATGATKRDTSVSYFRFITSGIRQEYSTNANSITRSRSGSEAARSINTNANDSVVYVQTAPGTMVKVRIPGLRSFPNSIIHRAELITEQDVANMVTDELMAPPRLLLLSAYDSVSRQKINIRNDYVVDLNTGTNNLETFGGFLFKKSKPPFGLVNTYTFNMSRYVQGIVTRRDSSYTLFISAPSNDSLSYRDAYPSTTTFPYYITPSQANIVANGRVRLGGGSSTRFRMRLRIVYSRI